MADFKEFSIEELEKALETSKQNDKRKNNKAPHTKGHKSVLNYIKERGLQSGDIKVANSVIYYDYRINYSGQSNNTKVGRVSFFHAFAQYFQQARSGTRRYYMLNIDLAKEEETEELANIYSTNYTKMIKKKKK